MLQHHSTPTKILEVADAKVDTIIIAVEKDAVRNAEEIVVVAEAVRATVI